MCGGDSFKKTQDSKDVLQKVNVDLTSHLAAEGIKAKAKRFIFLSSIAAMGEATLPGNPFRADDALRPVSLYGKSKHDAEIKLSKVVSSADMDLCTIRAPSVYGPGVKTNLKSLCLWVSQDYFIPLGGLNGRRHLVGIRNLISLICICLTHPKAANTTFLVADYEAISTTELIHEIAKILNKRARLFTLPKWFMKFVATMFGKEDILTRLHESLLIDTEQTTELVGWKADVSLKEELTATVRKISC